MLHRPNKIVVEGEIAIMDLTLRDGTVIKTIFDAEDVPKVRAFKNRWIAWYEKRMDKYYVLSVDTIEEAAQYAESTRKKLFSI